MLLVLEILHVPLALKVIRSRVMELVDAIYALQVSMQEMIVNVQIVYLVVTVL